MSLSFLLFSKWFIDISGCTGIVESAISKIPGVENVSAPFMSR